MNILKVIIYFDTPDGTIHECDAIAYQGGIWLVPQWNEFPVEKVTKPARIIRVDQLGLQPFGEKFVLNYQLPRAVFDCVQKTPPKSVLCVIEAPDITQPWAPGTH
jgi:hypothetical protein